MDLGWEAEEKPRWGGGPGDGPTVETPVWHLLRSSPGTILSQSLSVACGSNNFLCNMEDAQIVVFSPLRYDYGNVFILNIKVAKWMRKMWALN